MKKALLNLLKARTSPKSRKRVFSREASEGFMAKQLRSMGKFGQELVVMSS